MYPYGLIGNGLCSALVSDRGSVDWLCLPRPDSPPVFGRLLDPAGGHFSIAPPEGGKGSQSYLHNTNVLETRFTLKDGSEFRVLDFCPRFRQYERSFRPLALFRVAEPLKGRPFIKAELAPVEGWSKAPMRLSRGNSHFRYEREDGWFRMATSMPLGYLEGGQSFGLSEPAYFALTWGWPLEDDLAAVSRDFLRKTCEYWRTWVKHCRVPVRHQQEVIRSALALKLHCYEDTGAILAALTTSLPEERGGTRNWDYRFCWLRDAYFSLTAFHKLGHFEEMEAFLKWLLDLAESEPRLRPVYRLDRTPPLPELIHGNWEGAGAHPVRSGNQAAEHEQHDVYGELVLALAPVFMDERFEGLRHALHEELLQKLVGLCAEHIGRPDAGLWELRGRQRQHSFSGLMHWAGLDRAVELRKRGWLKGMKLDLESLRDKAAAELREGAVEGVVGGSHGTADLDASLLLMPVLRFPDKALNEATVRAIRGGLLAGKEAGDEGFLHRYLSADDFGRPGSAFVICSFWLVQALESLGRRAEAQVVMKLALQAANPLGLHAEHFHPGEGLQLGNFPQAYSHVGLIHAAFAVSESWDEVL